MASPATTAQPTTAPADPGPFSEKNTDLGKFSHGNFDVEYIPSTATLQVTLKVEYAFEKGITPLQQQVFKSNLAAAVSRWDQSGVYLRARPPLMPSDKQALNPTIAIRFRLVQSKDYHKLVDVRVKNRREWVGLDLNVDRNTSIKTLTHELGHVFANYDEYRGGGQGWWSEAQAWFERKMYWHDNAFLSQTCTVMQNGTEFPHRYFDHFEKFVNEQFKPFGIIYALARDTATSCERGAQDIWKEKAWE